MLEKLHAFIALANARRFGITGRVPYGSTVQGDGLEVGENFFASGPVWLEAVTSYEGQRFNPRITIGQNVRTSPRLHISAISDVTVGDWCLFGENVFISDHQHGATSGDHQVGPETPPALRALGGSRPVHIGSHCHLGNNVVVVPGTSIGDGCIIGANSVVSGSIPDHSIAVGAPARVVKVWDGSLRTWRRLT